MNLLIVLGCCVAYVGVSYFLVMLFAACLDKTNHD